MSNNRMTPQQSAVAEKAIRFESSKRRHLVVHLSGAHAYGFPSPDSDLDLKAIHVAPTRELLGFDKAEHVFNRLEFVDDIEVDYTSNELHRSLASLIRGDGNMLERLLSAKPLAAAPYLEDLKSLVPGIMSKRFYRHYRGFAHSQATAVQDAERPTAKKLLYVLRTTLTGAHLLLERQCQPDLTRLYQQYGIPEVPELIEIKQSAESTTLEGSWPDKIKSLVTQAFEILDAAHEKSSLPQDPNGEKQLLEWMLEIRRQEW